MEQYIQTMLQISLSTAVVIGILLLLIPMLRERYSAKWRKVIWLVIAIRLLVPFSLELPSAPVQMDMDLQQVVAMNTAPVLMDTTANQNTVTDNAIVPAGVNSPSAELSPVGVETSSAMVWNRGMILFVVWMFGMAAFILWHAVQYTMFRRKMMASAQQIDDASALLYRAGEDMPLKRYPDVMISNHIQGPMLVGFTKPVIVLPERIYGEQELLLILRHELMHYKQHDLWYKLLLLCANAVHWFNPLVWLMVRQANKDIEQVCDDNVVAGKDMDYRKAYSMTLLNAMASQRGVALSTYLSKDAQNAKRRFADILQPKQYKKGIAVLCAVVLLAVGISGCLQIGETDPGLKLYEQVAEFLPENAIHDTTVYETIGGNEDNEFIYYIWGEEPMEIVTEKAEFRGGGVYKKTEDGVSFFKRALTIMLSKENNQIISVVYECNDPDRTEPVKPAEIGRDEEARNDYINRVVKQWVGRDFGYHFKQVSSETDEGGNLIKAKYTAGNIADLAVCNITLNCQYGYVEEFEYWPADMTEASIELREETVMIEGLEEEVVLNLDREPDYYALYFDVTRFKVRVRGFSEDGSCYNDYVLIDEPDNALVKSYMRVGFTPDCTMDEWLERVQTDRDYVQYAPQINPLSSSWPTKWEDTGEIKVFPDDPVRQWKVLVAARDGATSYCYITPYRDGVMVAIISYPSGSEYAEGIGARMHAMMDTLVLASRGDTPWVEETNATLWDYTGYLDAYSGWESKNGETPFYADYDGDGIKDRVYREFMENEEYCKYQIEFANGEVQPLVRVSNIGYPNIEAADLTGDGQNEIIFQVSYPTSTNPAGFGDLVVFQKKNGAYQPMELPFETGQEEYTQLLPVSYKIKGETVEITVPGTDFCQVLPFTEETWTYGTWQDSYREYYPTETSTVWAYRLEENNGVTQMVCNLQLFDKWSECGLNVRLAYEDGALVIDDIQFCEKLFEE